MEACHPGREREERGTPNAAAVARSPRTQEQYDTPAVGLPALRGKIASFGPFRLHVTERLLEKNGVPVEIGSRALDILVTLLEQAPEVVSKHDLNRRAWGRLIVDEGSIRAQIARLRKRLDDEDSAVSYIANIPGRGYCFTGAVARSVSEATARKAPMAALHLPRGPLLLVGRDDAVLEFTARLKKQRFVSIVGPGGIGKTTVALALAHRMLGEFQWAIHFLDLAGLEDPRLLASMLASQLGVAAVSDQPLPAILTFLREQRMLLVFDSCEHLIEAVAALTENIFRDAIDVHILATSREALRAEGEQVHHLPPLECPPDYAEPLTAVQALSFPAVELFVKQVAKSVHPFELTDADAPIVAEICRRLDGIALALELAASRVGAHGVRGTASLLDKHFRLLWHGRRTALPRHQTLSATLDWSYNLLSDTERLILRRLAVFVGGFSLEAALDVAAESLDPAELTETLATLVDKSLVTLDSVTEIRYRLLDTTRAYAFKKLIESGEHQTIARRHCEHVVRTFAQLGASISTAPKAENLTFFLANLGNVRAALEWCFSDQGDTTLPVKLVAACACHFFQRNLTECVTWSERGIQALDTLSKGTRLELELKACLALSLMLTRGNSEAVRTILVRVLELAEKLGDPSTRLLALDGLYQWHIRSGDFRRLEELTNRTEIEPDQISDPSATLIAHTLACVTSFFAGDVRNALALARMALAAGVIHASRLHASSFLYVGSVRPVLANSLWQLGYPDQALAEADEAVKVAAAVNQPVPLCITVLASLLVCLQTRDWHKVEELIQRVSDCATKHNLFPFVKVARGWRGHFAVSQGDLSGGIDLLQTALADLPEHGFELYRPQLSAALAEALAKAGKRGPAYSTICEAIEWAHSRGRALELPDLLHVKGEILLMPPAETIEGERQLLESLQMAQRQGLLSLELRSGITLARLWADRGEADRALELLEPIFSRFSEGFQTPDLMAAAKLLAKLRSL
jgi:predicted ATPase/DNA-binding winged helix-turn-helix (wHTH) protein